jgi:hypothetical protein
MLRPNLTLRPLVAALIAQGDILHTIIERYPHGLSVGTHYGSAGHQASEKWRGVPKTGRMLPPVELMVQ